MHPVDRSSSSQTNEVAAPRLSVSQFFAECKKTEPSTPKAVLSAIKYAFSSQAGKEQKVADLPGRQQSTPAQQVASQRAAEPKNAPKFTMENTLERDEWLNHCQREYNTFGRDSGKANSPKEAAQYVMNELRSQFPDHEIEALCYLPGGGHSSSLTLGVLIRPKDDPFGTPRCISFVTKTQDAAVRISNAQFLGELNRLNQ